MYTFVTGFCYKCKCSVELERTVVTLDNKNRIVLYSGICPVCGEEIMEEQI